MTNSNPYATPSADVRDTDIAPRRPVWVWIIFVFYVFSAASTLISYFLLFSGAINIPEEQKQYMANLTFADHALTFLMGTVNLVAAVLFFRLKKVSAYLFPASFVVGLLMTLWHVATKGWLTAMGGSGLIGALFGWAIAGAVCAYAWRLRKNGVLK